MSVSTEAPRRRRTQERAAITKRKLVDVAIREFSENDFNGVTVRDIEVKAGVQRNLLKYHFGSKEGIWKAAAEDVFIKLQDYLASREELMRDLPPRERIAFAIRSFCRYAAVHPELHRLMIQEGKQESWRLHWILDNFVRASADALRDMVSGELGLEEKDFMHWYYLYAGGIPVMFSMAPEVNLLFGTDVEAEEVITRHADIMVELLVGRPADRRSAG